MAFSPLAHVRFLAGARLRTDNAGKTTLSTRRTEARRYAGHLRENKIKRRDQGRQDGRGDGSARQIGKAATEPLQIALGSMFTRD
jgi:hypothetical protein